MSPKKSCIKFARGFVKPTKVRIKKAFKTRTTKHKTKYEDKLIKLIDHFKPIPSPTDELDWLARYNEIGQTCYEFLNSSPASIEKNLGHNKFIYYIQIGEFNDKNSIKFSDLIDYSKRFFTQKAIKRYPSIVKIKKQKNKNGFFLNATLKNKKLNLNVKIKIRHDDITQHFQILTKSILNFLEKIKPKDAYGIIGLTQYDLYIEKSDIFVAGLCDDNRRVGVFSYFRYNPKITFCEINWHDIKTSKKNLKKYSKLLLARTCKLMVHETCHLLGFNHCIYMDCCMNGSGHIKEDYSQSMFLCPIDLKKLTLIFDFDIIKRYKKLYNFFKKHVCSDEIKILENLIKILEAQ